jgi:hypothetical protein
MLKKVQTFKGSRVQRFKGSGLFFASFAPLRSLRETKVVVLNSRFSQ